MSRTRLNMCLGLAQSIEQDSHNFLMVRELIENLKQELAESDTIGNHTPAMHAEWTTGPHNAPALPKETAA